MFKQKVLITGAVSLLGDNLTKELASSYDLTLAIHQKPLTNCKFNQIHLDITVLDHVKTVINQIQPQIIIHLASISNIDDCERHQDLAQLVNVLGTQNICQAIAQKPIHLIFPSSSMVFNGLNPPYCEKSTPRPVNFYGQTKLAGEKIIQKLVKHHTIIRFTTLFGWKPEGVRENDLTFYLAALQHAKQLNLVTDIFFNPLSVVLAAQITKKIIDQKFTGIIHIGGEEIINRLQLVQKIAEVFNIKKAQLIPVAHDYFASPAPRPPNASLSIDKIKSLFSFNPAKLTDQLEYFKKIREIKGN